MPWDGTELWLAQLNGDGSVGERHLLAGGANESIYQPQWSPDGVLHFISDRTGWWNLYRWRDNQVEALCPMAAEFGQPQWAFGGSLYGFASERQIVCSYTRDGIDYLATLDTGDENAARHRTSLFGDFPSSRRRRPRGFHRRVGDGDERRRRLGSVGR